MVAALRRGLPGRSTLQPIHEEILRVLIRLGATYSAPVPSSELAVALNVAPSYVRAQTALLCRLKVVGARRGRGGGYYLRAAELARRPGSRLAPGDPADLERKSVDFR